MEVHELIADHQERLLLLIKKYEDITIKMLDCEDEEVSLLVASRQAVLDRIDLLIKEVYKAAGEGSPEYLAFTVKCDRDSLSDENKKIFDSRLEFNSYAMRVHEMEPGIIERLRINRDKLREKIRENNSGQSAKAARYFNSGLSAGKNSYFPKNKRTI